MPYFFPIKPMPHGQRLLAALALALLPALVSPPAWAQARPSGSAHPQRKAQTKAGRSTAVKKASPKQTPAPDRVIPTVTVVADDWPVSIGPAATDTVAADPSQVYTFVEQMPQPPGSMQGLLAYLQKNVRYPAQACPGGKVFVSFVVGKTGRLTELRVSKGISPALDAEVLRVLGQMPPWKPGRHNGQVVKVAYTLPVTFETR